MPKEEKYTPLEFLQNTAGYITAVKELDTKDDKYLQNIAGKNEYLKIAFKQFKDTVKNKNHVIFEEVNLDYNLMRSENKSEVLEKQFKLIIQIKLNHQHLMTL
ncbi:hypothetical protein [Mycoplasmopsis cynos]|uniref:hypothetical protein n=1 Tax=Mycoplasmopsis cynos TaxID=171284 RepID=UPI0024C9A636|nr:hypothetical protein [Mycoplasmopsis cynos]WAM07972.1 hypothetical protein ONA21_01235 [Mycoplasmopsis cynos]